MTEQWAFLDYDTYSPAFNMAFDEALMDWHSQNLIPPAIRFYGWNPATLSLGYFQRIEKEINLEKVKELGLGLVRRMTGGRAVLHDDELTYSITISEKHEKMPKNVTEAYKVISNGLLDGFQSLGLDASFSIPQGKSDLKNQKSAICFDTPSWYELVVNNKKIAGSAQTRQKGVILQHGAIPLQLNKEMHVELFKYANERVKERVEQSFYQKAAAINDITSSKISLSQLMEAIKKGFEKQLDIELVPYELSEQEIQYIQQLAVYKYGSEEWTFSR